MVKRERHVVNGEESPTAHSISFLAGFIKDLGFRRIFLKCDNESSMKVFRDAMIHSCVEVAVREMKRQCRIVRISAEQTTKCEYHR